MSDEIFLDAEGVVLPYKANKETMERRALQVLCAPVVIETTIITGDIDPDTSELLADTVGAIILALRHGYTQVWGEGVWMDGEEVVHEQSCVTTVILDGYGEVERLKSALEVGLGNAGQESFVFTAKQVYGGITKTVKPEIH